VWIAAQYVEWSKSFTYGVQFQLAQAACGQKTSRPFSRVIVSTTKYWPALIWYQCWKSFPIPFAWFNKLSCESEWSQVAGRLRMEQFSTVGHLVLVESSQINFSSQSHQADIK